MLKNRKRVSIILDGFSIHSPLFCIMFTRMQTSEGGMEIAKKALINLSLGSEFG